MRLIDADVLRKRIEEWIQEEESNYYRDIENATTSYVLDDVLDYIDTTPTAALETDAQRWRYTEEEPPKEEDGDCCGRVLIAHAGAHCAVATSLQYARKNPEAVRVWMPLPKLPWEGK